MERFRLHVIQLASQAGMDVAPEDLDWAYSEEE